MREILFRGKPKNEADYQLFSQTWKDNCKDGFVYGSLVVIKKKVYICVSGLCQKNSLINNGITTMIEVIPETVGQYTGLTDIYGMKNFEGDIINVYFTDEIKKGIVKYNEDTCRFTYVDKCKHHYLLSSSLRIKVIGNIHNNPELLK